MTAHERRAAVAAKYGTLIGRNLYSQPLRDYCFRKYKDGNYYSDCSSSICYTYQEAGEGWGVQPRGGCELKYSQHKEAEREVCVQPRGGCELKCHPARNRRGWMECSAAWRL